MAIFTNQATLSYNGAVVSSNVVTGEIEEAVGITKTALTSGYGAADRLTYVVSLMNSSFAAFENLTVTDDLGAYVFSEGTLVPLDYVEGSLKYYVNGALQPSPAVVAGDELVISGITIPAEGNVLIIYQADVNEFAPLSDGASLTNTATVSGDDIIGEVSDSETVTAESGASLRITKSLSPNVVTDNSRIQYTFVIENFGNTPVVATDNAQITDLFDPILSDITVTLDGVSLTIGTGYSYNEATGLFTTVESLITVPEATYTQDPVTGQWRVIPGTATLVVTGTV